jgi:hypothetical protein
MGPQGKNACFGRYTPIHHQPPSEMYAQARLVGEEIRPIAPWNKWGSGCGFLTHARSCGAYISE